MKNKRKYVVIIIILTIFYNKVRYTPPERIKNFVLENEDDYTRVATLYYEDFLKHSEDILSYSCVADGKIVCHVEMFTNEVIILSKGESISAKNVYASYMLDKKKWDRVYVYDNYVSFSNENGRQSLVYSVDGRRPSYVNTPDEDWNRFIAKKITDNWYYTMGER